MDASFLQRIYESHQECPKCPSPEVVTGFFVDVLTTLFPDYSDHVFDSFEEFEFHMLNLKEDLYEMLYMRPNRENLNTENKTNRFFETIPMVYARLQQDIDAMYEGDPAAESRSEVIRSYPGFYAVAAYRFAHELYKLGVKIIPRMITEHAHNKTGIDIHPAATIGESFCIDHGTGIVIGATATIGDHVKIYQGVTLGALSVNKEDAGIKRHPTIEDHVVIYAGATILGGETTVGHHSVVGGNVWLTKSIPPQTKVYYQARMHNRDADETDLIIFKSSAS